MGICAGRRQSKTTVAGHERESAGNPDEALSAGDEGHVIGDGEEGVGGVADASVEGIVHRSASGCRPIAIRSRAGSAQVGVTGRSQTRAATGGSVEGARRMRLEAIHGLQQGLGVAREILKDVELIVEEVECDVFVGLAIAEELEDLGFCVDLIFEGSVQGIEENYADGGTGAIGSFAVGKDVGGQGRLGRCVGGRSWREDGDFLFGVFVDEGEVFLFESEDGLTFVVFDDDIELDQVGGGFEDGGRLRRGLRLWRFLCG